MIPCGNFARELAGSAIAVRFVLIAENGSQGRTRMEVMAAERCIQMLGSGLGLSVSFAALLCLLQLGTQVQGPHNCAKFFYSL